MPRLMHAVVWAVAAVVVLSVLWQLPDELRRLRSDVESGRERSELDRRLQPASSVGIETVGVFPAATAALPHDARFLVAGRGAEAHWARLFARYWLLPRRLTRSPRDADWVLSYGGDLGALGLDYRRVENVAPGVALGEVRRP